MFLGHRKLIKIGTSWCIVVPKDIAKRTIKGKSKMQMVAIFEKEEEPRGEDVLNWSLKQKRY